MPALKHTVEAPGTCRGQAHFTELSGAEQSHGFAVRTQGRLAPGLSHLLATLGKLPK